MSPGAAEQGGLSRGLRGHAGLWSFVGRGITKRCPRCGSGPMFERGARMRERCPGCGLRYLEDRGDPWIFLLVIDRAAFIFPLVVALYFGVHLVSPVLFIAFGAGLGAAFLLTTPNRYGVSVALVHWVRWRFRPDGGRASSKS